MRIFTADMPELQRCVSLEDIRLRKELVSLQWRKKDIKALHFLEKRCEITHLAIVVSFSQEAMLMTLSVTVYWLLTTCVPRPLTPSFSQESATQQLCVVIFFSRVELLLQSYQTSCEVGDARACLLSRPYVLVAADPFTETSQFKLSYSLTL